VARSLADALDRMLLQPPSQRFQSAAEVLAALKPPSQSTVRSPATPKRAASSVPSPPTAPPQAVPQAQPATPVVPLPASQATKPARRQRGSIAPFSTLELLGAAAFTGFECGLLAIALFSFLGTSIVSGGFWVALLLGLIFLQSRRTIERVDLLITAGITLAIVLLVPRLHNLAAIVSGNALVTVVVIAVLTGLVAIAVTALFRIIFNLLSTFL
ncbi:MAG: serine/threonine protein kinase, partial [Verrucomicrobia bacterium]|nr:serine/threonine protein kinase [Leptolyngbya sp. ES-bin-22]